jgi:hypothetical protein
MPQKPLVDFTDKELYDALHHEVEHVHYWVNSYYDEFVRRSNVKHTKVLNRWTIVIALATFINTVATVINLVVSLSGKK